MNKLDFLRRLDKELSVLEKEERRELLSFYEERFYSGTIYENKTEEEVIAELESPEAIARNVLAEYGVSPKYVKKKEERYSNIGTMQVILLITFDVIIATWIIPTLWSVAVSIIGSSFTWFGTLPLLFGERTTVDEFTFAFLTAGYVLFFLFGLVVLSAAIWVTKVIIIWHLNTFKLKKRDKWIKRLSRFSLDGWFKRHRGINRLKNLALVTSLVTIVYTGIWIFNHYDWVQAEYGRGEVQMDTITEDFSTEISNGDQWDIVTDFENMDIQIVLTDGDEVTVYHQYYDDDEFAYEFNYDDNVLTLSNNFDVQWVWDITNIFSLVGAEYKVRIEVPSSLLMGVAEFETQNGEVDIRNIDFDTIDISTSNGSVEVSNIELVDDITIWTSNGSIIVKNINVSAGGTLTLISSNGTIDVENVNFSEYYINTSNGRIELSDLNVTLQDGSILEVNTSNGPIDMTDVYVDYINLDTSNGNIDFYNEDTNFMPTEFQRDTSNGQINTNVR